MRIISAAAPGIAADAAMERSIAIVNGVTTGSFDVEDAWVRSMNPGFLNWPSRDDGLDCGRASVGVALAGSQTQPNHARVLSRTSPHRSAATC